MPLIRWLNRHGWIFSLTGLLCTAAVLYYIAPLLLTQGNAVPVFLWLLKELLVIALIAALCRGLLQGSKSLWLYCTAAEVNAALKESARTRDPEPSVAVCRELQAVWWRTWPKPSLHPAVQMALSIAFNDLGRFQEAEQEPNLILAAYRQYPPEARLQIESVAAVIKLKAGKPEDARSYLAEMARHVDKLPKDSERKRWQGILENRRCLYRLLTEGGSEELLSAYRQQLTGCKDLYDQVTIHMNLARCLLDLGRGDEARPHLTFVAENGGKLAIRAEASARLAALSPAEN